MSGPMSPGEFVGGEARGSLPGMYGGMYSQFFSSVAGIPA